MSGDTAARMVSCNLRYVVVPSEDLPGEWVSVCLDLGIVAQGSDPRIAIEHLVESIEMVIEDDLENDWDPLDRKPADEKYSEVFSRAMQFGTPVEEVVPEDMAPRAVVGYVRVRRPAHPAMSLKEPVSEQVKPLEAYQMWDLARLRNSDPVSLC